MSKVKLTLTIDKDIREVLHKDVGPRNISKFIGDLVRERLMTKDLDEGYAAMAADVEREAEAIEWVEAMMGGSADEAV